MPENGHHTIDDVRSDVAELKAELRSLSAAVNDIKISMARADERQRETTSKLDLMTIALQNNYVSAIEFGQVKTGFEGRVAKLESWNTWIVRLVVGAVVLAGLAALRIKGGI